MRTLTQRSSLLLLAATLVVGCAPGDRAAAPTLTLASIPSPSGLGAAEPNLSTTPDGRVLFSWLEPGRDSAIALRLAVRDTNGAWSAPVDVVRRKNLLANWADFPSVVGLHDGRLLAHWLQRNTLGRFSYEVRLAESRDGGTTWTGEVAPHRLGVAGEHGFVSLLPTEDGDARIVFLDGGGGAGSAMRLSVNRWSDGIDDTTKTIIDARICDCCQTSAAMTARGPIVVYRDRSDAEIRDISVLREIEGEWTMPQSVHDDAWHMESCPVNGPSVAADGEFVAVAWFTGARDTGKVQLAFSTNAGTTFGAPIRIDGGAPTGRVDVELLGDAALVSWLERTGGETALVQVRRVSRSGEVGAPLTVSSSSGSRSSGFPRMTRAGTGVLLAWTIPGSPSSVHLATLTPATP